MAYRWILAAAALGGLALAVPAVAEDGKRAPTCLFGGERYALGELACITNCPHQARLVRCEMSLNNTSWTHVSDVCPITMNTAPAVVAMTPRPTASGHGALASAAPDATAAFPN
jgi:hypothetical protein